MTDTYFLRCILLTAAWANARHDYHVVRPAENDA